MRGNAKFPALMGPLLLTGLAAVIALSGWRSVFAQHPNSVIIPATTDDGGDATSSRRDSLFDSPPADREERDNPLTAKQIMSLMQSNLEKSKKDAIELASLAKALREELNKPGANGASPEVVEQAEKIEKLAKKIRDETMVY